MTRINVDSITNRDDNGAVTLLHGGTVPSGKLISSSGDMTVVGVLTATSFAGDGTQLRAFTSAPKGYAIKLILDPLPFRS
jgi:hypothetical protein|tara:strand:- start:162 stop:401 length:240 start_codon:yes stop_codon:yes gene_type:complete